MHINYELAGPASWKVLILPTVRLVKIFITFFIFKITLWKWDIFLTTYMRLTLQIFSDLWCTSCVLAMQMCTLCYPCWRTLYDAIGWKEFASVGYLIVRMCILMSIVKQDWYNIHLCGVKIHSPMKPNYVMHIARSCAEYMSQHPQCKNVLCGLSRPF